MSDDRLPGRLAIESQYARLDEAVRRKDWDAVRALHGSDYRELQVTGEERGLAEAMAEWRAELDAAVEPGLQTEILGFDHLGDQARVAVRAVQSFISAAFAARRSNHCIETTRCDFWIRTDVGWLLSRSERQAVKSWIDGRLEAETSFEPLLTGEQRAAVVRDLRLHVHSLAAVLPGGGFDDLASLDRLIGEARIVALGEATHGTAEFFQTKHRLMEYLVEKKDFTVLAIEGNWPEAQEADRFIKTGEGDAGAALAAMYYWTWQTEELAALLHWMRRYNAARGRRPVLSFTGFDMQVPNVAVKRVVDFLDRTCSADADAVRALYGGIEKLDKWGSGISPEENKRLAEQAGRALAIIDERKTPVMVSAVEEYRDVRHAARIVLQAFARRAGFPGTERDSAMADNVRWLVEEAFPGQKIVLWAHNSHIGTGLDGGEKSLGDHLRDRYSKQMVIIGFATHHGMVRARRGRGQGGLPPGPLVAAPLAPAKKVSVEAMFQETGLARFILDLRNLPERSAVTEFLAKPRLHRIIGAVYDADQDFKYYALVRLRQIYDAIVFIAESRAAQPLQRR